MNKSWGYVYAMEGYIVVAANFCFIGLGWVYYWNNSLLLFRL